MEKSSSFFMEDVMETITTLILFIAWKAVESAEEESKHQRSGMSHRKNDRASSEFSLASRGLYLSPDKRVVSLFGLVWTCPPMADPAALLRSDQTQK